MPRHRLSIFLTITGALIVGVGAGPARAGGEFAFFHENVMGTSLELRVWADSEPAARRAEIRVLDEIDRLGGIFSGYDPSSEFSRWNASSGDPMVVSLELFEVLAVADHWRVQSRAAFDPRIEALSRAWSASARLDRVPTAEELAGAKALMSGDAWSLDHEARTARRLSRCPLSLDAIAKGYIVERACEAARDPALGIRGVLLNVGGDLRICGDAPKTIGIAPPRGDSEATEPFTHIDVRDRSVATSGDSQRGFLIRGRWYSHILDPATGHPVERTVAATVIAPRGADADALATIFNVLPVEDGLRLADSLPDVECLLVSADGTISRSGGWDRFERPRPIPVALAATPTPLAQEAGGDSGGSWSDRFEVVINFEVNRPEAEVGRYRRPYVVIWVEDSRGITVKTLVTWISLGGAGPDQWLPSLSRWYRGDREHPTSDRKNTAYTIGRPTRPPGTYSVIWDGTDEQGNPVKPGTYTVFIEAAREHGTHQIIRQKVTLADEPFAEELKGNVEIKSASIEYRRKNPADDQP